MDDLPWPDNLDDWLVEYFEAEMGLIKSAIRSIEDRLELDIGCEINRVNFREALINDMALLVGTAREEKDVYSETAYNNCRGLLEALEEMEDCGVYGTALLEELKHQLPDLRRLEKLLKNASEERERSYNFGLMYRGRFPGKRGRSASRLRYQLRVFATLYKNATGREPGTSSSMTTPEVRSGPFVRFVEGILDIIEPDVERRSLGSSIATYLRENRTVQSDG